MATSDASFGKPDSITHDIPASRVSSYVNVRFDEALALQIIGKLKARGAVDDTFALKVIAIMAGGESSGK